MEKSQADSSLNSKSSYLNKIRDCEERGNYDCILKYSLLKLEEDLKKSPKDNITIIKDYNNIAVAYKNLGKYDKALEYFKKVSTTLSELKEDSSSIKINSNITIEEFNTLNHYYKTTNIYKIFNIDSKYDISIYATDIYSNIAMIYEKSREYKRAIELYKKGINAQEKVWEENRTSKYP